MIIMYVRLRIAISMEVLRFFSHDAVSRAAATGTETPAPAAARLLQLSAAEGAAVILAAPYIVVQTDKSGIPGKPTRLAVELHLMLVQIQCLTDDVIPDALHPHTENLLLLCIGQKNHILNS